MGDSVTKCIHCHATVLSTSQPERDPADVWDAYCDETPAKRRSPQGALAFGFHAALAATPAVGGEALLGEVLTELTFARVFITSREKMHPCGVDLYDDLIGRVKAALDGPSDGEIYAAVSRRDMTPEEERLIQKALLESGVAIEQLAAAPASPLRAAMKRIEAVCEDNAAASCDHKLALDFVLQIATAAVPPEQPAADPFKPHENCNCLMCLAEKPR